ncbi:hypothetical protein LB543_05710 [Mesorhizobium sp. ESP7-2]|uniref:hypothetical protein n=1 Tax=Mesorhizobium sp. ESP7-2 TaxID=2876622 RepID=UPI001CCC64BE|nr:hypothetical protein [Mesorhizobium sp. ESP7-2]MBZ9706215.1 hypothetical protein [Mesorhizobium sp. ESP7-2]
MGADLFAKIGGELQIALALVRSGNRKQCLERHDGNSLLTSGEGSLGVEAIADAATAFIALNQTLCARRLIRINVTAHQSCRFN